MNQAILLGAMTSDPEMSYTANGVAITKFRMQTDAGGNRPADLHDIVCFGKKDDPEDGLAGKVAKNFQKGMKIIVQGRLSGKVNTSQQGKDFFNYQFIAFTVEAV